METPRVFKVSRRAVVQAAYWLVVVAVFAGAVAPIHEGGPPGSDKVEHFAVFAALMAGAGLIYRRQPLWRAALLLLLYGGLIEIVQGLPMVGRDRDLMDWLADGLGVACATAALTLWGLRARRGVDKPVS